MHLDKRKQKIPFFSPSPYLQAYYFILFVTIIFNFTTVQAATKKSSKNIVDHNASRAPAETVFVKEPAPQPASAPPLFQSSASSREKENEGSHSRPSATFGPLKPYSKAYGLYGGFYNAEVLGSNPYANFFMDLYPGEDPYFFEFTTGIGTVQSSFSESVVGGGVFPHNFMITIEALGGLTVSGLTKGQGRAGGLFPYFLGGITAIWQGGVPNIGGVLGFGNRMNLPFWNKEGRWAWNYGVRDHIYSQKIRSDPSLTQNFVVLIGLQKYF